jgi:hypothetical protein
LVLFAVSLVRHVAAIVLQLVALPPDFGLILLQIALQGGQLSSSFGIGLDQLAGAPCHLGLQLNQLTLLFGRLLGSLASGLGQFIFLAASQGEKQ